MQIVQTVELSLILSLIPFSLTLLLDLCLGKPAAEEIDRKAIFFGFSMFLAKNRLRKAKKLKGIHDTYMPNLNSKDPVIKQAAKMEYRRVIFEEGKFFFSWELGFGMCPFCTNVRLSIIAGFLYMAFLSGGWFPVLLVPCFSNMYLLFFNKFKF